MSDKKSVAVKLAGQTLYLLTEEDPEYVRELARYFSECMDSIRQGSDSASAYRIALLAGLRVVDELNQLKRSAGSYQSTVQDKVERVLSVLEEHETM